MRRLLLASLLLSVAACDSAAPEQDTPEQDGQPLVVEAAPSLTPSPGLLFTPVLRQDGSITEAHVDGASRSLLASSGLWISGRQGTLRGAAVVSGVNEFGPCGGVNGVFHLFADQTYASAGWPVGQGAPVKADGSPRVYGDEMLWTSSCQVPTSSKPGLFEGVRTNIAVYRHDTVPNVLFVRYEVANTSSTPMTDVTVAQWADPDMSFDLNRPAGTGYNQYDIYDNLVGLDAALDLGYIYMDPVPGSPGITGYVAQPGSDEERGTVAGVTFLETPRNVGLTVHRIMSKSGGPYRPLSASAQYYADALAGLDSDGQPQTDWTTGQPSPLAFTGDPVSRTGWLDGTGLFDIGNDGVQDGRELRQLLGAGSFTIAPGESVAFSVAWVVAKGSSLGDGLGRLRRQASDVQGRPDLWRF